MLPGGLCKTIKVFGHGVCLVVSILLWIGISQGFETVRNGRVYRLVVQRKDYSEAESYCKTTGGHLAKVSTKTWTGEDFEQLRIYVSKYSQLYEGSAWIGMTDRNKEGDWRWYDGSVVTDVHWEAQDTVIAKLLRSLTDCGTLLWNKQWSDFFCDVEKHSFICEYEYTTPPPEQTTTDTTEYQTTPPLQTTAKFSEYQTTPPVETSTESRTVRPIRSPPSRVSRVPKKTTIHKTASGKRVIGVPLRTKHVPLVTVCARLCTTDKVCTVFNYNPVTGYCESFGQHQKISYDEDPVWEVWRVIRG